MHELTLATSLVDLACDHAARQGAGRVTGIHIRLGAVCAIARSLYTCFEPAARGTVCEGARLTIAEIPLSVFCAGCNDVKTPRALYNFRCPDCGRPTPKVVTGREMELVSIDLDGLGAGQSSLAYRPRRIAELGQATPEGGK
jgi:hydrogenase nickel incorporation protein HypA/HybF